MASFKTPGVFIQEIKKFPPSVAPVETAIPIFIGYTERARKDGKDLTLEPTRITSLLEYETFFGTAQPEEGIEVVLDQQTDAAGTVLNEAYTAQFNAETGASKHVMYYCMQQFFANGGGPCYIVSVGTFLAFGTTFSDAAPFNNALEETKKEDEPTLIVIPESQGMDSGTFYTIHQASINLSAELQDRFSIVDFFDDGMGLNTSGDVSTAADAFRSGIGTSNLKYGAVYFPNIRSTFNYIYDESTVVLKHNVNGEEGSGDLNDSGFADLNGATRAQVELAIDNFSINLPPSATIAGIYARVDNQRGVFKAPANESISAIDELTFKVTNGIQDFLNVDVDAGKSINALRFFTGRGFLVWGARTLAGNDNEFRYVSVRRFFNFAEESIKKAVEAFVFEPNDANTWNRVKSLIENFLVLQWRVGALQGPTPESAFVVNVGLGETMTALDIFEGRMIVEIGMAVVRPAEFIILRFYQRMPQA